MAAFRCFFSPVFERLAKASASNSVRQFLCAASPTKSNPAISEDVFAMADMEHINRATWRRPLVLREYRRNRGYLNEGERIAIEAGLGRAPGRVILDIGVGAGRTAELLAPLATRYVGIDYTPEMVELARAGHRGVRFERMDARDLSAFADRSFDVFLFSYNGIDSVGGDGRMAILCEVNRVLRPGGVFVFSSFHRGWRGFGENMRYSGRVLWTANPVRLGLRVLRYGLGYVVSTFRWRRLLQMQRQGGEHAVLMHHAHDFGVLIYATTPEQIDRQLAEAGFEPPVALFGINGNRLDGLPDEALAHEEYFQIVAMKSPA